MAEFDPWERPDDAGLSGGPQLDPWEKPPTAETKKFGLMDTWPVRLAKGLYEGVKSGVTLPGDVYAGRVNPESPEATGRVLDAAGLALPISPAFRTGKAVSRLAESGVESLGGAGSRNWTPSLAEGRAAQQAADEFGVPLSRGQATGDLNAIRMEDMAARGAMGEGVQRDAAGFFDNQFDAVHAANRDVAARLARGQGEMINPSDAGAVVNSELGSIAQTAREATTDLSTVAEREAAAQRGMLGDERAVLEDVVRAGRVPIENPREAGEIVGQGVRDAARTGRENYQNLYDQAFQHQGQFEPEAFLDIGNRIATRLSQQAEPVIIDDVTTPIAARALRDLDNIQNLRIPNRTADSAAEGMPLDLRGVDQARKRLNVFYRNARSSGQNGASDARAINHIINEYDNQIEGLVSNGLFSGDPQVLGAIQQARAAFGQYARQFRPQGTGDDVGLAMRRIVDRNATPEEIANMIIGSGKVGSAGLPVRIADRLEQVLGPESDAWGTIRQALWQKASQVRNTAGEIDPRRSANGMLEMADSSLGRRLFTPQERQAIRTHATAVRDLERTLEALPATENANRTLASYQRVFSGEGIGDRPGRVFQRIIEGTATPEETVNATFNVIGNTNQGNVVRFIDAVASITGQDSQAISAIRQGIWQKLTQEAAGKDQPGVQKLAQSINEFLNGRGKTISERLYSPEELELMKRYANTVKMLVIPKYAATRSDTAPAMFALLGKLSGSIVQSLAGHVPGLKYVAPFAGRALDKAKKAQAARQSFEPIPPPPKPTPDRKSILHPLLLAPQQQQ